MNFYRSVFLEKNFFEKMKKVWFWGNYTLIFNLSDQSNDSKNYLKKFIYATNLWSCKTNLKRFKFWYFFYWKQDKTTFNFL